MKTPQFIKTLRGTLRQKRLERQYKFRFESPVRVSRNVKLSKSSSVGRFSYIGDKGHIFGDIHIGRYCSIANGFVVISGNHPLDSLTTHPVIYSNQLFGHLEEFRDIEYKKQYLAKPVTTATPPLYIGNDVWIGNRVTVLGKVRSIGNGAVIGAGSIVTKDIPPYAIVAGNPARIIRYRFDQSTIEHLEETKWWELPLKKIKHLDFSNVESCLNELQRIKHG
ncbi:CatB-related O-acetyltransferase [Verrucomicrobiota bacterium]